MHTRCAEVRNSQVVRVIYMKIVMSMSDIVGSLNALAEKNPIIHSALYFVIFDHGLSTSFRVVTHTLAKQSNIGSFRKIVDYAVSLMAKTSNSKPIDLVCFSYEADI